VFGRPWKPIWEATCSCPIVIQLRLTPWARKMHRSGFRTRRQLATRTAGLADTGWLISCCEDTWLLLVLLLYCASLPLIFVFLLPPSLSPSSEQRPRSLVNKDAVGYSPRRGGVCAECCCSEHVAICLLAACRRANGSSCQPGHEVHSSSASDCRR
jgi:hypothetical protein